MESRWDSEAEVALALPAQSKALNLHTPTDPARKITDLARELSDLGHKITALAGTTTDLAPAITGSAGVPSDFGRKITDLALELIAHGHETIPLARMSSNRSQKCIRWGAAKHDQQMNAGLFFRHSA